MSQIHPTARIFLVGNATKPEVPERFRHLERWLDAKGLLVGRDLDNDLRAMSGAHPDVIIALGGDGTILSVAQALGERQLPIIGVNLGKLGYLADFSEEDLERHLDTVLTQPQYTSRRMMLDVLCVEPDGSTWRGRAVNDCVIRVGAPFRTIRIGLQLDSQPVTTVAGDGLVISTPTGSTAHNLSCGGPIVSPEVDAFILTPKNPHSLAHRPLLVGPGSQVRINAAQTNDGTSVVLDGQIVQALHDGGVVHVRRANEQFMLVRNPDRQPMETLVRKLHWGLSPATI